MNQVCGARGLCINDDPKTDRLMGLDMTLPKGYTVKRARPVLGLNTDKNLDRLLDPRLFEPGPLIVEHTKRQHTRG